MSVLLIMTPSVSLPKCVCLCVHVGGEGGNRGEKGELWEIYGKLWGYGDLLTTP